MRRPAGVSLEAGGLPLQAQRRISEETQAGHPLFTSDLSTNEFSLVRNQGYTALSQVMGSSIYQVGWQFVRNYSWDTRSFELTTVSNAHQHAAQLALGRLEQEAALLNAHGVIGVRLTTRDYEWVREFYWNTPPSALLSASTTRLSRSVLFSATSPARSSGRYYKQAITPTG